MKFSIKTQGLPELRRNIKQLDTKLKRTSYRFAARKGGDVLLKEAKERAPERTGALKKALVRRAKSSASKGIYEAIITVKGGVFSNKRTVQRRKSRKAYQPDEVIRYYRFLELGTKYHPAKAFLEPSVGAKATEAINAFQEALQQALGRYLHR